MFYKWKRVKVVMAELWDPEDFTVGVGSTRLQYLYNTLCTDVDVRDSFLNLCQVEGELAWQMAAARWHDAVDRHISGLSCLDFEKQFKLRRQVVEILQGQRGFLQ